MEGLTEVRPRGVVASGGSQFDVEAIVFATGFSPTEFVVQGDAVVIFGNESGTVRATGQPFRNEWAQKYVVKDNQIVEMAEYNVQVEPRS